MSKEDKPFQEDHLDREIQRAIAQHELQIQNTEMSGTNSPKSHNNVDVEQSEKDQLQMIADELKRATSEHQPQTDYDDATNQFLQHHVPYLVQTQASESAPATGVDLVGHIPRDSELFQTSAALAAYNALSSHVPGTLAAGLHMAALPMLIVAPDYLPARIQLLVNTLPVLDGLASQLLRIFASGLHQKIIDIALTPESPAGAAYRDLTSLFEFTKRLYSEEEPFLTVEHIAAGMWKEGEPTPSMFRSREQTIELTLRKVNLATFLAATLGTLEVGFFHLNESFFGIFCPANGLDPANSMACVALQSLQSGVNTVIGDKAGKLLKPQASLLLDLKTQAYISAIEAGERSREEVLQDVLPSNMDEILLRRRGALTLTPSELDFVLRCKLRRETLAVFPEDGNLSEEYEWFAFLRELFDFVGKNMGFLIWGSKPKAPARERTATTPHSTELVHDLLANSPAAAAPAPNSEYSQITSALLPSEIQEQQIHLRINPSANGKITNRRPWTREEEKALRHALELKGPHWSTILELFGQGGRINEALKNRTQVQLKDKARNWKMFFLKSGLPVPAYLQKVTGDLERDDRFRARNLRNKKTAAAPVPSVAKRSAEDLDEPRKKR